MRYRGSFPTVSLRELSRGCGQIVDRVLRGERLIVCRHGRPVATLQPLTGSVVQPFEGREFDIHGASLGDVGAEVDKLSEVQRALLADAIRRGRFIPGCLSEQHTWAEGRDGLDDLVLRGYAKRGAYGGLVPTGRGIVLREHLRAGLGLECDDRWVLE